MRSRHIACKHMPPSMSSWKAFMAWSGAKGSELAAGQEISVSAPAVLYHVSRRCALAEPGGHAVPIEISHFKLASVSITSCSHRTAIFVFSAISPAASVTVLALPGDRQAVSKASNLNKVDMLCLVSLRLLSSVARRAAPILIADVLPFSKSNGPLTVSSNERILTMCSSLHPTPLAALTAKLLCKFTSSAGMPRSCAVQWLETPTSRVAMAHLPVLQQVATHRTADDPADSCKVMRKVTATVPSSSNRMPTATTSRISGAAGVEQEHHPDHSDSPASFAARTRNT
mmetsp:Transcript_28014/g.65090  ORF Transcript_28014/g.65090 Transcript_28014/m.65090 type:complete len:286 (-) Transcript_28014:123-980(-)